MLRVDKIIAISEYIKKSIIEQYKFKEIHKKIKVIHRGVDFKIFNNSSISQYRLIQEADRISLPDDKRVIMLPGRATKWKGHTILIEAASKIKDEDFILVLLGAGNGSKSFVQNLYDKCKASNLYPNFRIVSWSDDMPASLMLADVIVMPSIEPEPFGRIAVEAQAMGRPIVAFNHGGAKETIIDGDTGWLAKDLSSQELANSILKSLKMNARERKKLSDQAISHVKKNFSKEKMCDQTLEIYNKLFSD